MPEIFANESQALAKEHLLARGRSQSWEEHALQLSGASLSDTGDDISPEARSVLQAIPAGILFVDHTGTIALVNNSAKSIFDDELEGLRWRDVIRRHFRPQKDDGFEVSLVNGRKLKFSVAKIEGIRGQLIHLIDLTETRKLQSKVAQMQKLSSLGKMVASLAHQLRTPLSAAILYAANIGNKNATESVKNRFVDKLSKRLKELESQINDMLLFAKSGGRFVDDIAMAPLLEEIVAESREAFVGSAFILQRATHSRHTVIKGNRSALKGALLNIVQNAVAANATQVHLELNTNDSGCDIRISDNGTGIPPNLINQIFTPFFTTKAHGTGLGLAVVASVIKSHRGTVKVENRKGEGASFEISLPICQQVKETKGNPAEHVTAKKSEQFTGEMA